jgi:hypothetical protein
LLWDLIEHVSESVEAVGLLAGQLALGEQSRARSLTSTVEPSRPTIAVANSPASSTVRSASSGARGSGRPVEVAPVGPVAAVAVSSWVIEGALSGG